MATVSAKYKQELRKLATRCKKRAANQPAGATPFFDGVLQVTDTIWFCPDPEQFDRLIVLILGPDDTPYAHGFYLYECVIPSTYPSNPPTVQMLTGEDKVHMHPNMYSLRSCKPGKVCVSILNTWSGPGWLPSISLESVFITIQSLFTADPLCSEPAFHKPTPKTQRKHDTYTKIVEHANLRIAVLKMMQHAPAQCTAFVPLMQYLYHNNAGAIIERADALMAKHPKAELVHCDVWYNFDEFVDFERQCLELRAMQEDLEQVWGPPQADAASVHDLSIGPEGTAPPPSMTGASLTHALPNLEPLIHAAPAAAPQPAKKKRVYYRRPSAQDQQGRHVGDTMDVRQKDGLYITFILTSRRADPHTLYWKRQSGVGGPASGLAPTT